MALGALVSRTGASSGKPLIIQDPKVGIFRRMEQTRQSSASVKRAPAICSRLPAIALHIGKPAAMRRGPTTLPGAR